MIANPASEATAAFLSVPFGVDQTHFTVGAWASLLEKSMPVDIWTINEKKEIVIFQSGI